MGRRRSEISPKGRAITAEVLTELYAMLNDCRSTDGSPTNIRIVVSGAHEDSMEYEVTDLTEVLEILSLNSSSEE